MDPLVGKLKDVSLGKLSHELDHGIMIEFVRRSVRAGSRAYPPKIENVLHDTLSKILVLVFFNY